MKTKIRKIREMCAIGLYDFLSNLGINVLSIYFERDENKDFSHFLFYGNSYRGRFVIVLSRDKEVESFRAANLLNIIKLPCTVVSINNPVIESCSLLWNAEKNNKYLKSLNKNNGKKRILHFR